jgi:AcrR family transcriptional regulator
MSTAAERPHGLRQRKKQRTRQRIVEVARRLLGARGYHATTVADIAAGAGISVPTLFKYFPSKEEILFSDYPERRESIRRRLRTRPASETAIEATIAWMKDELPDLAARDPGWELTLRSILDGDPELEAAEHKRLMLNQHILAAEIARDLDEPEDHLRPQLLAATAVAALLTVRNVGRRHQTASPGDDPNELLDYATAFLHAGAEGLRVLPPPRY